MGWLRVFQEVAREHREAMGFTPSQQLENAINVVASFVTAVLCLALFLLVAGGR